MTKPKNKKEDIKEVCSKCGSPKFAIDKAPPHTRHCSNTKCQHPWLPKSFEERKIDKLLSIISTQQAIFISHNLFAEHVEFIAGGIIKHIDEKTLDPDQLKEILLKLQEAIKKLTKAN